VRRARRDGWTKRTVVLTLVLAALVGTVALATDVGLLYLHWARLQRGVDSAALAGAGYLPADPGRARQTAIVYAEANGIRDSELAGAPVIAPDGSTITVTARIGGVRGVLRAVGLYAGSAAASATAEAPYAPSVVGDGNGSRGNPSRASQSACSAIGRCDLLPIALDYRTPFKQNQVVALGHQGSRADGWDLLGMDGAASNARAGVANGYPGPLRIGDQLPSAPDGVADDAIRGLRVRVAAGQRRFPKATYLSHDPIDPRAVIVPMVEWDNTTHQARVKAFAALWVDGVEGATVEAHFIDQVAHDSPPDPSAPFRGARGRPILVR